MINYYKILGIVNSANNNEIRRAYRILARRYHPDLNPENNEAIERFKLIAEAYDVLTDDKKREFYDLSFEAYQKKKLQAMFKQPDTNNAKTVNAKPEPAPDKSTETNFSKTPSSIDITLQKLITKSTGLGSRIYQNFSRFLNKLQKKKGGAYQLSIVEISLSVEDAIKGIRRKIEISEPEGLRRVNVLIPAGVRDGSVVRLRDKEKSEDLVLIIRLALHPYLSIKQRGLVYELPISIQEAICGAQVTVPTIDGSTIIKIPPGSQSGDEIRLKEKGIVSKEGNKGDYFIRLIIKVPEPHTAVGLSDKAKEISAYYGSELRKGLPDTF